MRIDFSCRGIFFPGLWGWSWSGGDCLRRPWTMGRECVVEHAASD